MIHDEFIELMGCDDVVWTTEQKYIIERPVRSTVVIASPGSGKTTVLTEHIQHIVTNSFVKPSAISAVTFTRQAAEHMRNKLRQSNRLSARTLETLRIGTFHAQLFRVLLQEISDIPVLLNAREQSLMMQQAIEAVYGLKKQISRAMVRRFLTRYSWLVGHQLVPLDTFERQVFELYLRLKGRSRRWDYDDILIEVARCLSARTNLSYFSSLEYLLVDEFQDTNALQWIILSQLHENHQIPIFVVGDDDQSIYGFRGSSPHFLQRAHKYFRGAREYLLTQNFRSDKQIILHSSNLISHAKSRINKPLNGVRREAGNVFAVVVRDERDQVAAVINTIREYAEHPEIQSVGILARTRRQLYMSWSGTESLREGLGGMGVEAQFRTFHDSKGKEWDLVILLDMVQNMAMNIKASRDELPGNLTDCEAFLEEERRLIYVSMTRSRHVLVAIVPEYLNDAQTYRSRFLIEADIPFQEISLS